MWIRWFCRQKSRSIAVSERKRKSERKRAMVVVSKPVLKTVTSYVIAWKNVKKTTVREKAGRPTHTCQSQKSKSNRKESNEGKKMKENEVEAKIGWWLRQWQRQQRLQNDSKEFFSHGFRGYSRCRTLMHFSSTVISCIHIRECCLKFQPRIVIEITSIFRGTLRDTEKIRF